MILLEKVLVSILHLLRLLPKNSSATVKMAGDLLLITGDTGHIGFHTLLTALEAGYRVFTPLRSLSQAGKLLANSHLQGLNPGDRLRFLEVPDITLSGAYDVAIQGCVAVIHLASPRGGSWTEKDGDLTSYFIDPVAKGTISLLESPKRCGTVRKAVLGSAILLSCCIRIMFPANVRLSSTPAAAQVSWSHHMTLRARHTRLEKSKP